MLVLALALALLAAACGGSDEDRPADTSAPAADDAGGSDDGAGTDEASSGESGAGFDGPLNVVVANSAGTLSTTGSQRIMTALLGSGPNAYLGGPDQPVSVEYVPVEDGASAGGTPGTVDGEWLTTNASELGLYVSFFEFDQAGLWELVVSSADQELGRALIEVVEDSTIPNVGDPAPASVTPTSDTVDDLGEISTDLTPDPDLYDLTIADAVANGQPTVVVFATPAFCQTALCGPTLDIVKNATAARSGLDVVHVEPFDIAKATAGELVPVESMDEWGLVTEPWVFVVDADGTVAATFEGIIGAGELDAAIDAL